MPTPTDQDFDNFDDSTSASFGGGADDEVQLPGPSVDDSSPELEVEIVDDTPPRDRTAKPLQRNVDEPTDEELAQYSQGVQRRIKDLTHARHDERRRREALERENQAAQQLVRAMQAENQRLKQFVKEGSKQFGEMSVAAAEAKLAEARRKLAEANESFDTAKVTEAQEELLTAQLAVREAKNFKPPVVTDDETVVQTTQQQSAPAQPQLHPKTQAWMSRNRWFTAPEHVAATSYALGLDQELRNNGYDPRTDEYYEQVDARMKKRFPELYSGDRSTETERNQRSEQRERGSAVAPAVRTTSKRRVTLSASQIALCNKLGITPQQYAQELIAAGELK